MNGKQIDKGIYENIKTIVLESKNKIYRTIEPLIFPWFWPTGILENR